MVCKRRGHIILHGESTRVRRQREQEESAGKSLSCGLLGRNRWGRVSSLRLASWTNLVGSGVGGYPESGREYSPQWKPEGGGGGALDWLVCIRKAHSQESHLLSLGICWPWGEGQSLRGQGGPQMSNHQNKKACFLHLSHNHHKCKGLRIRLSTEWKFS